MNFVACTLSGSVDPVIVESVVVDPVKVVVAGTDLVTVAVAAFANAVSELAAKNCLETRLEDNLPEVLIEQKSL